MDDKGTLNRRGILKAAAGGGVAMATASAAARTSVILRRRPLNILMIVNDQERSFADIPSRIGLPGHEMLRRQGVSFENYYINSNPCGPSRSVIYTGQHTQKTGMYLNPNTPPFPQLSPAIPTIGHMLREQGYYTTYKGKWHLSTINERPPTDHEATYPRRDDALEPYGFSKFNFDGERAGLTWQGFSDDGTTASDAVNQLAAFRRGAAGDKPWFMAVNFINPHDVMFFDATGLGETARARPNIIAPLMGAPGDPIYAKDWHCPLPRSFFADDLNNKPINQRAIQAVSWAFGGKLPISNVEAWKRLQNYYFNCIRDSDRHLVAVLNALKANDQLDDTIIVFTSDHGERAGAHGLRSKGGTMYKEDIRVPLVIAHPDGRRGATTHALGSAVDLAPTLLGLAGAKAGDIADKYPALKGHDLTSVVHNPRDRTMRDQRGILFNYASGYGWNAPDPAPGDEYTAPLPEPDLNLRRLFRGTFDGRFKFARYFAPAGHHLPTSWDILTKHNDLEFYDTSKDPDEIHNLAYDEAARDDVLRLNGMTNALIKDEIGDDFGAGYPGSPSRYTLR